MPLSGFELALLNGARIGNNQIIQDALTINHVNINAKDTAQHEGATALKLAVDGNHYDTVAFLIENGANVNLGDNQDRTPLHSVAQKGYLNIARLLVEKGAKVDATTKFVSHRYDTPLHYAASANQLDIVIFLLEQGANCKARNKADKTPSQVASDNTHFELANLITNYHHQMKSQFFSKKLRNKGKIKELENQITALRSDNNNLQNALYKPSFFASVPVEVVPITAVTAIFMGVMLFLNEGELFNNKYKAAGGIFIAAGVIALVYVLAKGIKDAKEQISKISQGVVEVLKAGRDAIEEHEETTREVREVIRELGTTTNTVMVELKDEIRNSIIELTGNAQSVARAIERGINDNRFRPEARANINTSVHLNVREVNLNKQQGFQCRVM